MTDQEIRLQFGEMVGSEMRTAKAVVDYFERRIETLKSSIIATLNENAHLADGDVCTLKRLKDAVPEWEQLKDKLWCAWCGVWGDHQSGWCPEMKRLKQAACPEFKETK